VLVAVGVGIGVLGAFGLTRLIASQLFGVRPTDPTTFIVVALALIGVAALATFIPAMRATRVDPVVALRDE
jgi:ABC-type antimicrobial peptide transport system permease subunit